MVRAENENIAAMRFNKVVGKLVNKYLVACVDCASGNDFAAVKNATRENVEVVT